MPATEYLTATIDAEDFLIGALLVESAGSTREAINKVSSIIKPETFHVERNRRIYDAMLTCQLPPHQINVAKEMHSRGILENGDCSHLCFTVSLVPCSLDYIDYALAVKYYWQKRTGKQVYNIRGVSV